MEIKELIEKCHRNAVEHGFWEDWEYLIQNAIGNRLMLIVSELGEAIEALRHDDMDNFTEEIADACIRMFDLCGGLNIDLETAIQKKMAYNATRSYKHGEQF